MKSKNRQKKENLVKDLVNTLKNSNSYVLVDYSGLSVSVQQELKAKLSESKSKMRVVKNTLFKLAAKSANAPQDMLTDTVLSGPTALILAEDDPIAPLQVIAKFAKEHNLPQLKAGIVEGVFYDTQNLKKLSKLPSKQELYNQTAGAISAPIYALVGTLQGNLQKLLYILKQKTN